MKFKKNSILIGCLSAAAGIAATATNAIACQNAYYWSDHGTRNNYYDIYNDCSSGEYCSLYYSPTPPQNGEKGHLEYISGYCVQKSGNGGGGGGGGR